MQEDYNELWLDTHKKPQHWVLGVALVLFSVIMEVSYEPQ
jgi:hypothetical protein